MLLNTSAWNFAALFGLGVLAACGGSDQDTDLAGGLGY